MKLLEKIKSTFGNPSVAAPRVPSLWDKVEAPEDWHVSFIEHLASILKPKTYLELGLYECELFNKIGIHTDLSIGVDMNPKASDFMLKNSKMKFVLSDTLMALPKVTELLAGRELDLLFIDADHSKNSVRKDFETYFPLVREQGIILFHDAHPKNIQYSEPRFCGDGYQAIFELSQTAGKEFEIVTIPVHPGVAICRKRSKPLSWS